MALKPDRMYQPMEDISRFWPTGVVTEANVTAGGVVCSVTSGSGIALDSQGTGGVDAGHSGNTNTVSYVTNPSGAIPVGLLTQDIRNDQTSEPRRRNFAANVAYVGGKVHLITKGWVVTNKITGTPTAGQAAYLHQSGYVSHLAIADQAAIGGLVRVVGRFLSNKDQDGYAKVFIDL